jgi:xanthine dehydrogenase accessory factor
VIAALSRRDLPAVGLIGSETKWAPFEIRLNQLGIPANRLICLLGLAGIAGKEPAVVAVSIAAQILQLQPLWPELLNGESEAMATTKKNCGDCACPPVAAQALR